MQSTFNVKQCILECKYPSFWDILFQYFWVSDIFKILPLSSKYSNFFFCSICLQLLVFKRATLCNWQHLGLQILYNSSIKLLWFTFIISVFCLFKVNTMTPKQRSPARCFQVAVLLQTDKVKRIKMVGDSMARFDLL